TIDFDDFDFSPFFNTSKILDNICKDSFLATDIKNKEEYYEVITDVPGLDKKDIKVIFKENYLHIKVSIPIIEDKNKEYILRERIHYGELSRSFKLQDSDPKGDIKVKLKDGILKINLPKSKQKAAREIKIM
ncbi:MAG: Hsp20 family protein, partial [Legionellales bacterium]|nr:Hsp20 family protein [Legionellales bacterium]